ncbi:MAG: glycoside hydrolase family 99-like domain-containing protein, partial [Bacteroidales bacterium]|nr:glycoside hydrolase family 99-like domain-containing protein [Bacteroidales bacterium]
YQFCHFVWPDGDYEGLLENVYKEWERLDKAFTMPYYPHVTIGWDNSPRYGKSPVITGNTPEKFEEALRHARAFVDAHPGRTPLITINSWNEWTETSYLQPDNVNGYGYLEAVKKVFVDE